MIPSASPGAVAPERRQYSRIRAIFEEAGTLIAPFFAKENHWGNATLDHLAYRLVRDRYPELSFEEVHVLVVACRQVHAGVRAANPSPRALNAALAPNPSRGTSPCP